MSNFYIARNGKQSGPFTSEQLTQMAASGMVSPDDQIAQQGGSKWVAASVVPGLLSETPVPAAAPISAAPEETEMPWLSGAGDSGQPRQFGGSTTSTNYRSKAIAHKPATKNQALPFLIGGAVAAVLLVLGGIAFVATSVSKVAGGGSLFNSGPTQSMTKMQFRQKVKTFRFYGGIGDAEVVTPVHKIKAEGHELVELKSRTNLCAYLGSDWVKAFGEPTKTQSVAGSTIYYWQCSDGLVQVVFDKTDADPSKPLGEQWLNTYYWLPGGSYESAPTINDY